MERIYVVLFLVVVCYVKGGLCVTAGDIAREARNEITSRTWLYTSSHVTGRNTNKCNIFVADILKRVEANAPERRWWKYSPIGAMEWANSSSSYLRDDRCWERCYLPSDGDVIATGGHVGIVTGYRRTTSASAAARPAGLIVENDWGFRSDQNPTCWRFKYSSC